MSLLVRMQFLPLFDALFALMCLQSLFPAVLVSRFFAAVALSVLFSPASQYVPHAEHP